MTTPTVRTVEVDYIDLMLVLNDRPGADIARERLRREVGRADLVDPDGASIDPVLCDCGKGAYCPLWDHPAVIRFYGNLTVASRAMLAGSRA